MSVVQGVLLALAVVWMPFWVVMGALTKPEDRTARGFAHAMQDLWALVMVTCGLLFVASTFEARP